eukprot:COSAG06_NODE_12296_length_1398_cov_2.313318_1_plen_205_part_10
MPRAAALAHLALLASGFAQQEQQQHSSQLHAPSERRALQAGYVMDDAAIATAVAECAAEAPDFVCPVSQATYGAVGTWDISAVTSLAGSAWNSGFFGGSFQGDLSGWSTGQITTMFATFSQCASFTSDLSAWQVGQVTTMQHMFYGATSFTSDLSGWNVGQVTNMAYMFGGATSFTSDLSAWQVGQVTTMQHMFYGATSFTSDLS